MLTTYNAWRRLNPTSISFRHGHLPKSDRNHNNASPLGMVPAQMVDLFSVSANGSAIEPAIT